MKDKIKDKVINILEMINIFLIFIFALIALSTSIQYNLNYFDPISEVICSFTDLVNWLIWICISAFSLILGILLIIYKVNNMRGRKK